MISDINHIKHTSGKGVDKPESSIYVLYIFFIAIQESFCLKFLKTANDGFTGCLRQRSATDFKYSIILSHPIFIFTRRGVSVHFNP